jgi:hypothetical protein
MSEYNASWRSRKQDHFEKTYAGAKRSWLATIGTGEEIVEFCCDEKRDDSLEDHLVHASSQQEKPAGITPSRLSSLYKALPIGFRFFLRGMQKP